MSILIAVIPLSGEGKERVKIMMNQFEHIVPEYELISQEYIEEVKSWAGLLRHKKTGAKVAVLSNEDKNKVFNIAFRTPPKDSTGVAHILEHSVLCGSRKFPPKDPFVELVKGSLNTFLNAMTYPDKTMYPVASCNDKDFHNLMHVYLDAVFYPNIYSRKEIFEQEGWHYELERRDGELTYNGVVYNEMKGAFSSPEQVLYRMITTTLFPDTTYSVESGGDPDHIPELTYEQFLDFHSRYYHPSNSYIYLYGDFNVNEQLEFIDKEYLSHFDALAVDSQISLQKPFDHMHEVVEKYALGSSEQEKDNTYLSYNVVLKDTLDPAMHTAFQILDYVLMSAPGAVLKKALIDSGIARDVLGDYSSSARQPYMSIIAKNSNTKDKEIFLSVIRQTLEKLVREGINRRSLEGAINYFEFRFREADYGRFPAGLMYGIQMMDSWLYDDQAPFIHLKCYDDFAFLRSQMETGYFENLIEKYLLNNPHASLLILEPEKGQATLRENRLKERLAAYKASLSDEQLDELIEATKHLKYYQETPSTQAELETIPMLSVADIDQTIEPVVNSESFYEGYQLLSHNYDTRGIGYVKLIFDMRRLPERLLPYAGLLTNILGNADTKNYTYQDLTDEINIYTGGIGAYINIYQEWDKENGYHPKFEVSGKAMFDRMDVLLKLMGELIFTTKFEDTKRIREIVAQTKSRLQMYMNGSGHVVAVGRATSFFSESGYYREQTSGLAYYQFIKKLDEQFDSMADALTRGLKETAAALFRKENLLVDATCQDDGIKALESSLKVLDDGFYTCPAAEGSIGFEPKTRSEAFLTSGMVQYDVMAGNFKKAGFEYHGGLHVLKIVMDYEYMWTNLRVKGGAYGCMCGFSVNGNAYFASYRDPNLKETLDIYRGCGDYLRSFNISDRDMNKYIIGAISAMDVPMTPQIAGARSLAAYIGGISEADYQKVRDELLSTNQETIRGFAPLVESFVNQNNICVVGSESQIDANKDIFDTIEAL